MPKEVVYGAQLPWGEDYPAVAVAQVCWSREAEYVQLVTGSINRTNHSPIGPPGPEGQVTQTDTDGFYVDLDRRGINQLIRQLRRARDAAFGRDE